LDDIALNILAHLNHVQNEHENLMQQLKTSEKLNNDLRSGNKIRHSIYFKIQFILFSSESTNGNQTMQQTYLNTINELNQQLSLLKQQNDQLETEKYLLNQQLENQSSISFNKERSTPTPGRTSVSRNYFIYKHYYIDSKSSDSKVVKKHMHPESIHEVCTMSSFFYSLNLCLL